MLEANADFAAAVASGNRIKYFGTSPLYPEKEEASTADRPEVRVVAAGLKPWAHRTSNGSSLTVRWEVQVSTGDQRTVTLLDLDWAIYCALAAWQTDLRGLTWNGSVFVVHCRGVEVQQTKESTRRTRNIREWQSVWAAETDIWVATADIT